ncbi:hypothetical protein PMI28_03978 [Pseudomonas sp. GM48]|nr:hypothetical protein PMI28_03978 [Pseudomonas sp. GM48]
MKVQNGTTPPTPKVCPNLAHRYLFTLASASADLVLLIVIEVTLWIA